MRTPAGHKTRPALPHRYRRSFYAGTGTVTNRFPASFSTTTAATSAGATAAEPSSPAPLPSPARAPAPTTQLPAVVRLPSRPTTTSRQRSPFGTPVTAACTRTQPAAGVTRTVIRAPDDASVAEATRVPGSSVGGAVTDGTGGGRATG
ncbi:hypothetical protein AB0B13_28200, partial [Streptomyces sp. NPDC042898]